MIPAIAEKPSIEKKSSPTAINQESPFKYDELFFSVTDPKSRITYANDVFVRISKYETEQVIGQLHNFIRHPDMPRSVFKIFWDYLKNNKPVAAYVKNMAKDGSYYWVMALAFPCEGGYLSIRLKPGSGLFNQVKKIYSEVLKLEQQEEKSSDQRRAIFKGEKKLLELLKAEGYSSYQEFMWRALRTEMEHREEELQNLSQHSERAPAHVVPPVLYDLESILGNLVLSLEELQNIHGALVGHSDYILKLARSILLLSLNAQIGSAKLDQNDLSLSVVAEKMGEQSVSGEEHLLNMKDTIFALSETIGTLNFDIISAKLQVEMTIDFLKEQERTKTEQTISNIDATTAENLLNNAYTPTVATIIRDIENVPKLMNNLLTGIKSIERFLMVLRFIHITGKVEVARMNDDAKSFSTTFQDLVREIETAETHLKELTEVCADNKCTGSLLLTFKEKLEVMAKNLN